MRRPIFSKRARKSPASGPAPRANHLEVRAGPTEKLPSLALRARRTAAPVFHLVHQHSRPEAANRFFRHIVLRVQRNLTCHPFHFAPWLLTGLFERRARLVNASETPHTPCRCPARPACKPLEREGFGRLGCFGAGGNSTGGRKGRRVLRIFVSAARGDNQESASRFSGYCTISVLRISRNFAARAAMVNGFCKSAASVSKIP